MPITRLTPQYTFTEDRLEQLKQVVPEAFADGLINWETLREILGDHLEDEDQQAERFGLFWPGKRQARRAAAMPPQGALLPAPGEGVNEEMTRHVFIEGENLEVLKLLRKAYAGKVKMIYIDPPYNTGNDFVYRDDYAEPVEAYLRRTGQKGEAGELLTTNPKSSGRYHSNWLNMMYPRLRLAKNLLSGDGVIMVSIDDNEVHNLRHVLNEVFGEENFVDCIVWKKRYGGGAKEKYLVTVHEYVLFYARDVGQLDPLFIPQTQRSIERYYRLRDENFPTRGPYRTHPLEATRSMGDRPNLVFPILAPDGTFVMPRRQWLWSKDRVAEAAERGELAFLRDRDGNWSVHSKQYLKDEEGNVRQSKSFSIIDDVYTQHGTNEIIELFGDAQVFAFPKPTRFATRLLDLGAPDHSGQIVLDFFAGSGTTAQAILEKNRQDGGNRQFIMVQLPEPTPQDSAACNAGFSTVADIGKERIRRVITRMKQSQNGQVELPLLRQSPEDLGFRVYKLSRTQVRRWQPYEGESTQAVADLFTQFQSPLVEGWDPDALRVEIMLQEGFPLDSRVERMAGITGNAVNCVASEWSEHHLFICLDETLAEATVEALPGTLGAQDIFVCLDSALSDEVKLRLADRCNVHVI